MPDPTPARNTFAALAALILTVAAFHQLSAVPSAYAAPHGAALA